MIYRLFPRLLTCKSCAKKAVICWRIIFWLTVVNLLFPRFFFFLDLGWDPALRYIRVVSSPWDNCAWETWAKMSPGDLSFGESEVPVLSFTVLFLACYPERTAELLSCESAGAGDAHLGVENELLFRSSWAPLVSWGPRQEQQCSRSHPSSLQNDLKLKSHRWIWDFYWRTFSLISCDFVGRRGARRRRRRSNRGPQKREEVFRFGWEWRRWRRLSGSVTVRALEAFAPPRFLERGARSWLWAHFESYLWWIFYGRPIFRSPKNLTWQHFVLRMKTCEFL